MRIAMVGIVLLLAGSPLFAAEPQNSAASLEQKILGKWEGGSCMGDYIFSPDGTFEVVHFSPGNNILTGTWSLRWDAIPPTLLLTHKTSDFQKRYRDGSEYQHLGKTLESKLIELNDESLVFQFPGAAEPRRHRRGEDPDKTELAALQGTWIPLQYEEREQSVEAEFKYIIKGDKVTVQIKGDTNAEGTLVLRATSNPRQMDLQFPTGQSHSIIYVRTENYLICCGNRDAKTRPTEFATGTAKGGDYLIAWKIQH